MAAGNIILSSTLPMVQVVLMASTGALAVRTGLLSAQGAAAMNRLVYYVFLPALVLTSLGSSATAERIANWWFMLINCWINVLAGLALGAALATVLRLQRDLRPAYIACCGIGSFGNIPLILVDAISKRSELFEAADSELGVAYIFTSLISGSVAVFAVGNYILRDRPGDGGTGDSGTSLQSHGAADPDMQAAGTVAANESKSKSRSVAARTPSLGASDGPDSLPPLVAYRPVHSSAAPPSATAHAAVMSRQAEYTWRPSAPEDCSVFSVPGVCPSGQFGPAPAAAHAADKQLPHTHSAPGEWRAHPAAEWLSARRVSEGGSGCSRPPGLPLRHALQTLDEGRTAELVAHSVANALPPPDHRRRSCTGAGSIVGEIMVAMDSMPVSEAHEHHSARHGLRGVAPEVSTANTARGAPAGLRRMRHLLWAAVQGTFLNPPTVAVLVAVAVALIGPVKRAFFGVMGAGPDAAPPPLDVVAQVLRRFGAAMIPALMIALGGSLARGPGAAVPVRAIVSVIAVRLVVLPVAGSACVLALRAWGAFSAPDAMFTLVALLQQAMPSALNVFTLAAVHGNQAAAVATLLFWQYLASIFTIPACVAAFLSLL